MSIVKKVMSIGFVTYKSCNELDITMALIANKMCHVSPELVKLNEEMQKKFKNNHKKQHKKIIKNEFRKK